MNWTAEEARYAVDRLITRRKIRPCDVERALGNRQKEIQTLRKRLSELDSISETGRPRRRRAKRSSRRLSARARSQVRLQGKYMGYVRRLTAAQKNHVRKVRKGKGWREAIRMAAELAKARVLERLSAQ